MLHHLSGGRFTLGVGRGGPWVALEVFGTGLARFERGFPESLDLLVAALSGGPVTAGGEFFAFREVTVVPAARMRPVVACTSPGTAALAADRACPCCSGCTSATRRRPGWSAATRSAPGERTRGMWRRRWRTWPTA